MHFLVGLSDVLREVQYLVAVALHLVVQFLNRVQLLFVFLYYLRLYSLHDFSKLPAVFKTWLGAVYPHLVLQLSLL